MGLIMNIKEIEQCDDVQKLYNELEITRDQIFASQNFKCGQMFVDAKSRQNAIIKRAKELSCPQ